MNEVCEIGDSVTLFMLYIIMEEASSVIHNHPLLSCVADCSHFTVTLQLEIENGQVGPEPNPACGYFPVSPLWK